MARKFSELREKMDPERRARNHAKAEKIRTEMALSDLRRARNLTQQEVAAVLHLAQSNISDLEKRTDLYISTLRRYIEGIGGKLEIFATFGDQSFPISTFGEESDTPEPREKSAR